MKASKFTDAQKAFIIRQGEDGTPVEEICRKAGISQATYFNWKKTYSGMMPSEMRRLGLDDVPLSDQAAPLGNHHAEHHDGRTSELQRQTSGGFLSQHAHWPTSRPLQEGGCLSEAGIAPRLTRARPLA